MVILVLIWGFLINESDSTNADCVRIRDNTYFNVNMSRPKAYRGYILNMMNISNLNYEH